MKRQPRKQNHKLFRKNEYWKQKPYWEVQLKSSFRANICVFILTSTRIPQIDFEN